jgi:hypothetical protein
MGESERQSRKRYAFGYSKPWPEPTAIAEADAKQAFMDILDVDVIKPLATFKVNEQDIIWACVFLIVDDPEGHHR